LNISERECEFNLR